VLYFRILAAAGATNLLLVTFLIPASAILLGALVLGEVLQPRHFLGMTLIAASLAAIDGRLFHLPRNKAQDSPKPKAIPSVGKPDQEVFSDSGGIEIHEAG
jgi:hypothetical protein